MLDFAALPPEVNSGLMYTGPGSGSMLAAAAAWDVLATELYSTAVSYGTVVSDLAAVWLGPSSILMVAAATPFVSWITAVAGLAEATGVQAMAAVAAYEAAYAMTVPPPVIAANRALLMLLVATNFFGQNTPAIMATEAQYMEMWAQDAAAMYGYQTAAQTASTFTSFTDPPTTTAAAGLGAQTDVVTQVAATPAGTAAQTVSPLTTVASTPLSSVVSTPLTTVVSTPLSSVLSTPLSSVVSSPLGSVVSSPLGSAVSSPLGSAVSSPLGSAVSSPLGSVMTTPLSSVMTTTPLSTAAAPNMLPGFASASSMSSSSSLSSWTTSSTAVSSGMSLASGTGSSASMFTPGISATGSAGSLMPSPTASVFGNHFQALGGAVGNGFGSGSSVFGVPGMGSPEVTVGVGRAASVGMLSVPQNWASAAPAFSQVGPALPGISAGGAPAAATPGGPGGSLGMPMLGNAARGTGNQMPPALRIGYRPTVVQEHVYGG